MTHLNHLETEWGNGNLQEKTFSTFFKWNWKYHSPYLYWSKGYAREKMIQVKVFLWKVSWSNLIKLRPYSHETFWHTILQKKILRYKDHFEPQVSFGQGKLLRYILFWAYLGWVLKPMAQKYIFIALSFYIFIAILCAKMSRVNKA